MRVVSFVQAGEEICSGRIGVIPADTIYGIVGSALDKSVVERIYAVRARDIDKPCIILLSNIQELATFGVTVSKKATCIMNEYWPGALSIVLPCNDANFSYLHRGTNTLAFRIPNPIHTDLTAFLRQTGPIIAPSANVQGGTPARSCEEAYNHFGDSIDFYVDGGFIEGTASTVLQIIGDNVEVLREGVVVYRHTDV